MRLIRKTYPNAFFAIEIKNKCNNNITAKQQLILQIILIISPDNLK